MTIQRNLLNKIKPFLERKEYISIVGPRQAGKSTFLNILRDYLIKTLKVGNSYVEIITFEDRKLLMEFEKDPISFIKSYIPQEKNGIFYLMIDEFQYAKEGGQRLKLAYDTIENVKIIITGSSSLEIRANVGRFMVGRMLSFSLYPFNFVECLSTVSSRLRNVYDQYNQDVLNWLFEEKQFSVKTGEDIFYAELEREYEKFCIWGGYPAVVLAKHDIERRKLLSDIYNNYILKDIKSLLELSTENNLFLLSQYLATQTGNIVVYQNLSQSAQLDYRNMKKHLAILEETFVCNTVKPFYRNRQKELSKNPKVFFMDLGFRNNLLDNMNKLDKRSDAGAQIENAVFIRLNELREGFNKINFWRTKTGAEVDFILHIKDNIVPIEVKYSSFNSEKISKSLASFLDSFNPRYAIVLTKNYWSFLKRDGTNILFMPVFYL